MPVGATEEVVPRAGDHEPQFVLPGELRGGIDGSGGGVDGVGRAGPETAAAGSGGSARRVVDRRTGDIVGQDSPGKLDVELFLVRCICTFDVVNLTQGDSAFTCKYTFCARFP